MDQVKIGNFIAEVRKAQGLTQKELAEKLNLSDKTVSKWECGKGLPDNSIMMELCDILQISVNELLSGERLSSCEYNRKAEENIMSLMQETHDNKDNHKWNTIGRLMGALLLIFFIALVIIANSGINGFYRYLDWPTFLIIVGIILLMLIFTDMLGAFCRAFRLFLKAGKDTSPQEVEKSYKAVKLSIITALIAGALNVSASCIALLYQMDSPSTIGPHIAVACLSIFYSAIIALLLLPIVMKLKSML